MSPATLDWLMVLCLLLAHPRVGWREWAQTTLSQRDDVAAGDCRAIERLMRVEEKTADPEVRQRLRRIIESTEGGPRAP